MSFDVQIWTGLDEDLSVNLLEKWLYDIRKFVEVSLNDLAFMLMSFLLVEWIGNIFLCWKNKESKFSLLYRSCLPNLKFLCFKNKCPEFIKWIIIKKVISGLLHNYKVFENNFFEFFLNWCEFLESKWYLLQKNEIFKIIPCFSRNIFRKFKFYFWKFYEVSFGFLNILKVYFKIL